MELKAKFYVKKLKLIKNKIKKIALFNDQHTVTNADGSIILSNNDSKQLTSDNQNWERNFK